jgi:hypothetical protein
MVAAIESTDHLLSGKDKHHLGGLANLVYLIPIGVGSHVKLQRTRHDMAD